MGSGVSWYMRTLVAEEMRGRVASAAKRGATLDIPESAAEIAQAYPGSALSEEDVGNRLFAEAARAGVAVEIGKRRAGAH